MKVQLYPKGHTSIWQGEQGQALFMIIDGAFMLSRTDVPDPLPRLYTGSTGSPDSDWRPMKQG